MGRKYLLRTSSAWDQNHASQNRRDYANVLLVIISGKKAPGRRYLIQHYNRICVIDMNFTYVLVIILESKAARTNKIWK